MATPAQEQAAYDTFVAATKHPIFFSKLAAAGYSPRTEDEAQKLIHLGDRLYAGYQDQQVKEAQARHSFLDFAIAELDGAGLSMGPQADTYFKQAAAEFVSDPNVQAAGAVLVELY
jgi:hypothetical protein